MKRIFALLLTFAALSFAADKKIVVRGSGYGFSDDDTAIELYQKAAGDDATVVAARSSEEFAKEIVDAHGIIGGISKELFPKAKNLEWVQSVSAGVEAYSFWPEFMASDVMLTNCKVVQGPTIGDHAFALLLSLTRGLHEYLPNKRQWKSRADAPKGMTELPGMTAVIIGMGGIGTQIAQRAHAFGMDVIGVDPKNIPVSVYAPTIVPPDRLDEVLPKGDVVFVAAPLTPESERMIAAKQFEAMKKGAYFIAVSRGRLYDKGDLVKAIAVATAREVAATGVDWTFAPTLAVVRDDRWGRTYESFSEHPDLVVEYAPQAVTGLQGVPGEPGFLGGGRVLATAKHFLGEGQTTDGRDQGDVACSEETLQGLHAGGHLAAIAAGAQTVMAAYNSWNGTKVHGHRYLLTDVLKGFMGFDGFVVSDWDGFLQVADDWGDAVAGSVNAGVDMLMVGVEWRRAYHELLRQVTAGTVPMARVDDAVRRILRVKARARLFSRGRPSERAGNGDGTIVGDRMHRECARRAVRRSLVLLKNDGVLPLRRDLDVLVAGDGADDIGKQCGGWTLTWQGTGNDNTDFPNGTSVYRGIAEAIAGNGGSATFNPNGEFTGSPPDIAIVVFGENPYAEGDGDRTHLSYSGMESESLAILRRLRERGIPTVSVFLTGRPMWVNPELNASDAFVVAWLPGTEGGGVADVLVRGPNGAVQHDFQGRLSFSWPRHALHTPLNVGDTDYAPLFPYGYGLTYGETVDRIGRLDEADGASGVAARDERRVAGSGYPH